MLMLITRRLLDTCEHTFVAATDRHTIYPADDEKLRGWS
jgi:hypothetical protein